MEWLKVVLNHLRKERAVRMSQETILSQLQILMITKNFKCLREKTTTWTTFFRRLRMYLRLIQMPL
jgi:hypothetical protein